MKRRTFLAASFALAACQPSGSASPTAAPQAATNVPAAPVNSAGPVGWTKRAAMPTPRSEIGGAAIGARIYAVGGLAQDARGDYTTPANDSYDTASDRWVTHAPLPEPLHHPGVAALDGLLYVVGGFSANWTPLASTWIYDPATDRWRAGPALTEARGGLAVVALGGALYAVGGYAGTNLATVERLDGAWRKISPLADRRDHLAAAVFQNSVHAIGGRVDGVGNRDAVEQLNGDRWQAKLKLPTARSGIAAEVVENRLHVFGGEGDRIFPEHEAFDGTAWTRLPDLPTPRHGLFAATVNGAIYVIGGGTVPGYSVSTACERWGR